MLPNKMKISHTAFNSLRRLQNNTGLTVNIGARLAFFESMEKGVTYHGEHIELTQRELDKYTWLGNQIIIVEMLLKGKYPQLIKKDIYKAWGYHIEYGAQALETKTKLSSLTGWLQLHKPIKCNYVLG